MKIYLVRHGEADTSFPSDSPLTKKGKNQAKQTAKLLQRYNFQKIFCSDLKRAKQTCEEFLSILKKEIHPKYTEDLNEIYRVIVGGPEKEGTSKGREKRDRQRAKDFYDSLISFKEENILIFCYGNIIRYFISRFENKNLKEMWVVEIPPGSITILDFNRHKIERINYPISSESYEYV